MKNIILKVGAVAAMFFAMTSISTACYATFHEPKMPEQLMEK